MPWSLALLAVAALAVSSRAQEKPSATGTGAAAPAERAPTAPVTSTEKHDAPQPPVPTDQLDELPPTYYLYDSQRRLVPVIGMTYADWDRLSGIERRIAPDPPQFRLESVTLSADVDRDHLQFEANVKARISTDRWVRIPLRLSKAMLVGKEEYIGTGKSFVEREAGSGCFWWVKGTADQEHELKLRLLVPLKRLGPEWRFELDIPEGIDSRLRVDTALARADLTMTRHVGSASTEITAEGRCLVVARGLSGDIGLGWRADQADATESQRFITAVGDLTIDVESPELISVVANLTVDSVAGPLRELAVRLPNGAQLVSPPTVAHTTDDQESIQVSLNDALVDENGILPIRFPAPIRGPMRVRIETRHRAPGVQVANFAVLGAVRQTGNIHLYSKRAMDVRWETGAAVVRHAMPPSAADASGRQLLTAFQYHDQPCQLSLTAAPKTTRVRVEPNYQLYFAEQEATLTATLRYRVLGDVPDTLKIDMTGWQVSEINPPNLLHGGVADLDRVQPLIIPLASANSQEFQLQLIARRSIDPEVKQISLPLPGFPETDSVHNAVVNVSTADNVRISLSPDQNGRFIEQASRKDDGPANPGNSMHYWIGEAHEPVVFTCDFKVLEREVTVDIANQVRIVERSPQNEQFQQIEQQFQYTVAHESIQQLLFDGPADLMPGTPLQLHLDGDPLSDYEWIPSGVNGSASRLAVRLPRARKGEFQLSIQYEVPIPNMIRDMQAVEVPLLQPADGIVVENRIDVAGEEMFNIRPSDDSLWVPRHDSEGVVPGAVALSTNRAATSLVVSVTRVQPQYRGTAVVGQAWIQTCLLDGIRRERAVFRVVTDQNQIAVRIPSPTPGKVLGRLDGEAIHLAHQPSTSGKATGRMERYVVSVPDGDGPREWRLEINYESRAPIGGWGTRRLEFPIVESQWTRHTYWQLFLAPHEQLMLAPRQLTAEHQWTWLKLFGRHRPRFDQAYLEDQLGASRQAAPAVTDNDYLFSLFGQLDEIELQTFHRPLLAVMAAALAFALGVAWIHIPKLRHPTVLLALTVWLVPISILAPPAALELCQLASLGLAMAGLAWFLRWMILLGSPAKQKITGQVPVASPESMAAENEPTRIVPYTPVTSTTAHDSHESVVPG